MDDHDLLDRLGAFVTPHKRALFDRLAPERTRHVTVVLEELHAARSISGVASATPVIRALRRELRGLAIHFSFCGVWRQNRCRAHIPSNLSIKAIQLIGC